MLDRAMLEKLRALDKEATPGPWTHGCDEVPPDTCIEAGGGGTVCHIQPHGNVRTVMRTGQEFNHADARLITAARNAVPSLLDLADAVPGLVAALEEIIAVGHLRGSGWEVTAAKRGLARFKEATK
jgi:hypothetical protein